MAPRSLVLTYFNARGRGEMLRWILVQAGVDYTDKRISMEEWAELKPKTLYGMLPMLTVDGVDISQSGAIFQFLATEYGLSGESSVDAALIHMIWNCLDEFVYAIHDTKTDDEVQKAKAMKKFEEVGPKFMGLLKSRLDGKQWLVGNKVSAADLAVACRLIAYKESAEKLLNDTPEVNALIQRVTELPSIKKWIETRPDTKF